MLKARFGLLENQWQQQCPFTMRPLTWQVKGCKSHAPQLRATCWLVGRLDRRRHLHFPKPVTLVGLPPDIKGLSFRRDACDEMEKFHAQLVGIGWLEVGLLQLEI